MDKHILGLDIGTNSIGWVLISDNKILGKGVNIFPIGTNVDKNGMESTKNRERGLFRRTSRNNFRFKLRRKNLKLHLDSLQMLPVFENTFQVKKKYQASELYRLRANALDNEIPRDEIGRIFLLINKHRGFKSNSKTLSEGKDDDSLVKDDIRNLAEAMKNNKARTLGEHFHKMYCTSSTFFKEGKWHNPDEPIEQISREDGDHIINKGIRREGRFAGREMYEKEFDLIWDKQKEFYHDLTGSRKEYDEICNLSVPEKRVRLQQFKLSNYWKIKHETIFFQRPLKSQKKFIGKCQFEKNKRTSPASAIIFQEFRIWKQLSDVRYSDKENGIYSQPLPLEWKQLLADYLSTNLSLNLKEGNKKKDGTRNKDILDVLGISNKKNFEFNNSDREDEKIFTGNKTLYAIYTACGSATYNQLNDRNELEKLWHTLYMAKDDEWLKDTLEWKWSMAEDISNRLMEMGLEEGFGNYSGKVLKKILPHMKQGHDEHSALIIANYLQAPDEYKEVVKLNKNIKQLSNNELRNPVVEKAVSETIKLVNTVLETYQIDQEDFTIRIESTREFKKPKKERENIRRKNLETENRRIEYAKFLNEKNKKGELNFRRDIWKNDSIINKFELWLELGADKNDPGFVDFEKIVDKKDREKHILWLDCNRICPYTGRIIPLSKLFSPEIEIEHIIPYSRSLDDSFLNKTLTFSSINAEKKDQTAYEFMKSKGDKEFKDFKIRVKTFGKEKCENRFLKQKVESAFTNAQSRNASYIAVYVRKKLQEVCRDVQFTNGFATSELRKNDWRLGNLLDKIRYQEQTGIDIDKYAGELANYKKDFEAYRKRINNSTDIIKTNWHNLTQEMTEVYERETKNPLYEWWSELQKFDAFRGAKGKKDRSDHRHHLLDAIVIAMCSPKIIQRLSSLSQMREKQGASLYDEKGDLAREKIELPLPYSEIKKALEAVLVFHKSEQRLITMKQNRIQRNKAGLESSNILKQKTAAPRGSLHKATFYGKIKSYDKKENIHKEVFVSRYASFVYDFTSEKSLEAIHDEALREIIRRRIQYFKANNITINKEAYDKLPLRRYSLNKYTAGDPINPVSKTGNGLPLIKKVRTVYNFPRKMIQIASKENGTLINSNRYAESDGNYIMALYELKVNDKNGNEKRPKRDFILLKFFDAVKKRTQTELLFPDEKQYKDGTFLPRMGLCPSLKQGDFVILYEENEKEINWTDIYDLKKRLFKVTQLSSSIVSKIYEFGYISLAKHNVSTTGASYLKEEFSLSKNQSFLFNSHQQLKAVKVIIDRIGNIKSLS